MGVNNIGQPGLFRQPGGEVISKAVHVGPELLLGQVFIRTCLDSYNLKILCQLLNGNCIVGADVIIHNQSGDQIHTLNAFLPGQGFGQFNHVFRLAARIGVTTQLQVMASDQAMDTDEQDIETTGAGHINHDRLGEVIQESLATGQKRLGGDRRRWQSP